MSRGRRWPSRFSPLHRVKGALESLGDPIDQDTERSVLLDNARYRQLVVERDGSRILEPGSGRSGRGQTVDSGYSAEMESVTGARAKR